MKNVELYYTINLEEAVLVMYFQNKQNGDLKSYKITSCSIKIIK